MSDLKFTTAADYMKAEAMVTTVKTSELTGAQLDWAVAFADGEDYSGNMPYFMGSQLFYADDNGTICKYSPSTNWAQGGPIIERENINLVWSEGYPIRATIYKGGNVWIDADGPNPLTAAMRCYVASKLGDEFEVPDEG